MDPLNSCQLHDAPKIFLISSHFSFHIFTPHFIFCLACYLNEKKKKIKLNYNVTCNCLVKDILKEYNI